MSEFFSRYVDELLSDPDFRARHPHFHVRLFPVAELAHVIVEPEGSALVQYSKALAALLRGDPVPRIKVDIADDVALPALVSGDPVLQAARDAGVDELWADIRYLSRDAEGVWWSANGPGASSQAPTLDFILNEDGEVILAEDGVELVS